MTNTKVLGMILLGTFAACGTPSSSSHAQLSGAISPGGKSDSLVDFVGEGVYETALPACEAKLDNLHAFAIHISSTWAGEEIDNSVTTYLFQSCIAGCTEGTSGVVNYFAPVTGSDGFSVIALEDDAGDSGDYYGVQTVNSQLELRLLDVVSDDVVKWSDGSQWCAVNQLQALTLSPGI